MKSTFPLLSFSIELDIDVSLAPDLKDEVNPQHKITIAKSLNSRLKWNDKQTDILAQ